MSRSRGDSKQDRKVRETVNLARPGTAGTTTPPISSGYMTAPAAKKQAAVVDDYDDDDFEAYDDDDFEEDEEDSSPPARPAPVVAQAKPAAKGVPGMKPGGHFVDPAASKGGGGAKGGGDEMEQLRLSMQSENTAAMEARRAGAKSESPDELRGPAAAYARQFKAASPVPSEFQGSSSPDSRPQATSKHRRAKKFASMDIADEGFAFGPREARLRQLRDANILEMRVDTFSNFNLAPTTKFDTYQRQLRGTPAQITQVGVPFLTEYRDIEVATEPIDMVDKEVQFGFGDETDLLNIIACIKSRRENSRSGGNNGESKESRDNSGRKRRGKDQQPSLLEDAGMASKGQRAGDSTREGITGDSAQSVGNSLSAFLQRSSLVMESLLVEMELKNLENRNESSKARSSGRSYRSRLAEQADSSPAVFNSDNDWFPLGAGGDNTSGYMEYVRTRPVSFIQFSSLQPNVLITGHPPPEDERAEEDLKPNSALYCVWDVTSPASPIRLLSSPGFPTAAAFSAGQSFLVLAGTLEGSLHLWDLRESNALHIDRDAADLKVYTGVRRACYTAYDHITATSNNASGSSTISQHSGAIVKVESIDTTGGDTSVAVSSQFVTLDEAGFITIWLTSEDVSVAKSFADDGDISAAYKGNVGGDNDAEVGLSPQGMVKLVKRRVIAPDCSIFYSHHEEGLLMTPGILPVVAVNPLDPSVLLVSVGKGIVYRGSSSQAQSSHNGHSEHRVVATPLCYRRTATKNVSVSVSDPSSRDRLDAWAAGDKRFISELDSWSEASYYSPVTCIAPSCTTHQSVDGSYVLVGHADGTVDLYSGKAETPMVSWSLCAEAEMSDTSGSRGRASDTGKRGVALIKWFPSSTTAFVAVDTLGAVYAFDLMIDASHPVEIDSSAEDKQKYRVLHQQGVSLSGRSVNVGTGSGFLAMCRNKTKSAGNGRYLSDGVLLVRRINPALMMTGLDSSKRQIPVSEEGKEGECKDSAEATPSHGAEQIPAFNMARDTLQQTKLVYSTGDFGSSGRRK